MKHNTFSIRIIFLHVVATKVGIKLSELPQVLDMQHELQQLIVVKDTEAAHFLHGECPLYLYI